MLLAGIFTAKRTQQKLVECLETSSIIQTHKKPLRTHNYFLLGSSKKIAETYRDVTLVNLCHIKEVNLAS
jgi:hypothetical protein